MQQKGNPMRKSILGLTAVLLSSVITPAFAQEEEATSAFSVTGGAAVVSDYRFRGLSQTNEEATVQGWATVSHDSGFYAGFWGSGVGFANGSEIDALVGYSTEVTPGVTVDGGIVYYIYPGAAGDTDYFEPYLSLSGNIGPVTAKVGAAWVFGGQSAVADQDNIYLYTDVSAAIPSTPLTVKAHYGYSDGFVGAGGNYADYMVGVDAAVSNFTLGVSYVNTTGFASKVGKELSGADGALLFTLTAGF